MTEEKIYCPLFLNKNKISDKQPVLVNPAVIVAGKRFKLAIWKQSEKQREGKKGDYILLLNEIVEKEPEFELD